MKNIKIPYSTGYKEILLDEARIRGILKSGRRLYGRQSQEELVRKRLSGHNSARLRDMAKDANKDADNYQRPYQASIEPDNPAHDLEEARSLNRDIEIKILIATGFTGKHIRRNVIEVWRKHSEK